jgi:hypothetical protein
MKVGELIDILLEYHEDLPVILDDWGEGCRAPISLDVRGVREVAGHLIFTHPDHADCDESLLWYVK